MVDVIDVQAVDSERAQALKTVGWISYILHLMVAVGAWYRAPRRVPRC